MRALYPPAGPRIAAGADFTVTRKASCCGRTIAACARDNCEAFKRDVEAVGKRMAECRPATERERQEIALRLASPMRPGAVDPRDANDTPLFIAANEPELF